MAQTIERSNWCLIRWAPGWLVASCLGTLAFSAAGPTPFWNEWQIITSYREMSMEVADKVFAVPSTWIAFALGALALWIGAKTAIGLLNDLFCEYTLYPDRIEHRQGIIAITQGKISIPALTAFTVHQSVMGRLLGYGSIKVFSMGEPLFTLMFVKNPVDACNRLEAQKNLLRRRKPLPPPESP